MYRLFRVESLGFRVQGFKVSKYSIL